MLKLKSIIVDDEWLVRNELKIMLAEYPEIDVVGEATNVPQAIEVILELKPDVIFLDIQMPGATGFDLLERIDINCKIIFITAYDQYAIKAFEVNAIDYLLKPIKRERLGKTIFRLLNKEESISRAGHMLSYEDVAYVVVNKALKFIKVSAIKCIIAEGNYSYLYYNNQKKELISKTLQEWEEILPSDYFVRIHRSTIVNFEYVENVSKCQNYTYLVKIQEIEKQFIMSRRYAARLKKILPS